MIQAAKYVIRRVVRLKCLTTLTGKAAFLSVRRTVDINMLPISACALLLDGSTHKVNEQRMWLLYLALELGMELHANEPGMFFQFYDLHQVLLRFTPAAIIPCAS